MLGRGLESLIPQKGNQGQNQNSNSEPQSIPTRSASSLPPQYKKEERYIPELEEKEFLFERKEQRKEKSQEKGDSIFLIETEKIKSNPYQPRTEFEPEAIHDLAQSIREFGIIQPLTVSKVVRETETGTDVEYQLIAGERRLKAARLIGLERVPVIVKLVDHHRAKLEMALIENIQRVNLNPIESAKAYARLQDEFNLTHKEIATKVGKSREVVSNTLRLLNLPTYIQEALSQNKITESVARTLLTIENPERQKDVFLDMISGKTSMGEIRERMTKKIHVKENPEMRFFERQLEERLSAPVKIIPQGKKGKIVIQYYSEDERDALVKRISGELL